MNKRQQAIYMRRLFARDDPKQPPVHNLRALKKATYFARANGLEIPSEYAGRIIVKVLWLLYDRECDACRVRAVESGVSDAAWGLTPAGCTC